METRSSDAVEECLAAFVGHRFAVEHDEEIDRAKIFVDDRRTANPRTDAKVHIEEARQLNRFAFDLCDAAEV